MKPKNKNSELIKVLILIVILIPINLVLGQNGNNLLYVISTGLLFVAVFFGLLLLIKMLFGKKEAPKTMPKLSKEKEKHYVEFGMTEQEISFFRETMADAKVQINTLENNMQDVAKLKAINLRYDTIKASRAMFKEIVKEPNKLHQADRFLYNHLPNLVELTSKYLEINQHELKNKDTFEALNQSALAIEEVSQLVIRDYANFVKDDIEDLDVEVSIAKQNIDREKELEEYKQMKEFD